MKLTRSLTPPTTITLFSESLALQPILPAETFQSLSQPLTTKHVLLPPQKRSSVLLLIPVLCAYLLIDSSKVLRRVFIFNHSEPRLFWLLEAKQRLQLRAHLQNLTSRIAQELVLLLTPISSTKDKVPNFTNIARDSIIPSTVSQGAEENESGTSLHL